MGWQAVSIGLFPAHDGRDMPFRLITSSAVMRIVLPILAVSFVYVSSACAQRSEFEFTVSGDLVDKLEPGTRVLIWNPVTETQPRWVRFSIEELPVSVPFKQLSAGHNWIAEFTGPKDRRLLFSIVLSPDLFDKPRKIDLKLDRPNPRIRPSDVGRFHFQYVSAITQRMSYNDLPCWDQQRQRLVAAKPPVMTIFRRSDGVNVHESQMENGCMGLKWFTYIDDLGDLGTKMDLQLSVRYESGGLWGPIETNLDFTYQKSRHGR